MDNAFDALDSAPSLSRPPASSGAQASNAFDQFDTPAPQLKPPSTSNHSTIGDLGRSAWGALASGTGELVQGIGDIGQKLDQVQGVNTGSSNVQALGKRIQNYGEQQQQNVSPEFAKKTSQSILTREGFNPTNIANKAINSIAGMAPALVGTAAASLAGPEAAIPVGAALFGAQGEAGGRNAGAQQVAALSDQQLAQIPKYQQYIQSGMSPANARAQFSADVANRQALVQGAFGAGLGLVGEVPGVDALGHAVGNTLVRPIGDRAAQAVGKGVAEGAGFAGINAAGQVASNVTNPVPTPTLQGVGDAAAEGLLPGFVLGGARGVFTRPVPGPLGRAADTARATGAAAPEPYPNAAPGTLSDAANTLHRTAPASTPTPEPNTQPATANGGEPVSVRLPPPAVPWVDAQTGAVTQPTDSQVLLALHGLRDQFDAQKAAGNKPVISSPQTAAAWGIPTDRFNKLKSQMTAERRGGVTTTDAQARLDAEQGAPQEPVAPDNPVDTLRATGQAQDARLRHMLSDLDETSQTLAQVRARLTARQAASEPEPEATQEVSRETAAPSVAPETPAATPPAGNEDAAASAARAEPAHAVSSTPPAPDSSAPAAEGEPRGTPRENAAPESQAPAPTDQPAGESQTPSAPASAPVDRATAADQVPSSEPSKQPVAAETTPNVGENQGKMPEQEASAQAAGAQASAKVDENAAPPVQPERVVKASVPLGAGMSDDGKTLYVDHRIPETLDVPRDDGTTAKVQLYNPTQPREGGLAVHEGNEFPQMLRGKKYQDAHDENANAAEDAYYQQKYGVSRAAVDKALKPYLDAARDQGAGAKDIPADLDRTPYTDGGDEGLLGQGAAKPVESTHEPAAVEPVRGVGEAAPAKPDVGREAPEGVAAEPATPGVEAAAKESAAHPDNERPEPTPAQHEAGNFKSGHVNLHGLDVTIQVPKGGVRRGTDSAGKPWERAASDHYGHIRRTEGADGEPVDVYLGPHAEDPKSNVFVVDQVKPGTKTFDEHKAMVGFKTGRDARASYDANFPKGMQTFGGIRKMSMDAFKDWVKHGDTTKPVSDAPLEQTAHPSKNQLLAKHSGFPVGGWHAVDERGNVLRKAGAPDGTMPPRFKTAEQADAFARRQLDAAAKTPEKPGAIEDFGEKLGGARKDQAPSLRDELGADDIRTQPLSKIWPASEVDAITDPFAAAVAFAARAEIPAKPRVARKLNRWVDKVQAVRELARHAVDGRLTPENLATKGLKDFAAKVKLLQDVDRSQWSRIGDVRQYPNAYAYDANGKEIPKPSVQVEIDGRWERYDGAKSIDDAMAEVKQKLGTAAPEKKLQFEIRGNTKKGDYFINKKGDGEYRRLKTFTDLAEARAYLKNNHDELVKAWQDVKDRDNVTKADMRNEANRDRVGPDYRDGKDVTPEQFADTMGFRGVEFGNWVKQGGNAKERQGLLNQAYDALMDLANLIGVPPRAMSLDGSLGLGLGSRGHGWASAHFEHDRLVINLTKTRGAGALAHEWFHALDNYFARSRGEPEFKGNALDYRKGAYVTYRPEPMMVNKARPSWRLSSAELASRRAVDPSKTYQPDEWQVDPNHPAGVRPVVEKAFSDLVKALNESPMRKRAESIDKGKSDGYWSRIIERAARSFENYVIARMEDKGLSNDYLANVRQLEAFNRNPARYPYLRPEEVKPVAEAFDNLFATLETRKGENGNVALFSRSASTRNAYDQRIDELFANPRAPRYATLRVLDRADVLDMLGHGDKPLNLIESAVGKRRAGGENAHQMTAADWKKVPEWIENPVAVFKSQSDPNRLVFLAPDLVNDRPVRVILEPNSSKSALKVHVLVNAYDESGTHVTPVEKWWKDNKDLLYLNQKLSPAFSERSGLRLPGEVRQLRGYKQRVLTDADLVKYRADHQDEGAFSAGAASAGTGMPRDQVQKLVDVTTAKWGDNQPRVRVLADAEGLPASAKQDAGYKTAEGYYDPKTGTAYLVAKNLKDPNRAMQVLAHEVIGHHGVENVVDQAFGAGAWQKVQDAIGRLDKGGRASDTMRSVLEETHRRYAGADPATFAKEFLAVSAEKGIRNAFLDRVVSAIRKFLRQIMPNLQINERDLRGLLAQGDRFVREETPYRDRVAQKAAMAFSSKPDTFYSALRESVDAGKGAPKKADVTAWKQWLDGAQRRGEFKGAEREWMGLDQWLDEQKGPVSREALVQHVRDNQVRVQEVMHADDVSLDRARDIVEDEDGNLVLQGDEGEQAASTKFGEYTLPGGKNYRELLLTLPTRLPSGHEVFKAPDGTFGVRFPGGPELTGWRTREDAERSQASQEAANFRSGHFDEPNILAHVRMNDRMGPDGEKILHVEEVQSDMHQQGRKHGYARKIGAKERPPLPEGWVVRPPDAKHPDWRMLAGEHDGENAWQFKAASEDALWQAADAHLRDVEARFGGVPDAPFKKTEQWSMLAMKRVLRYAADHGYDKVTWTTGEQQAERYDLSKSIDRLIYLPKNDGGLLFAYNKDGRQVLRQPNVKADALADYVGKEAAKKLMDQPTTADESGQDVKQLKGADLKLGGEGMKAFYDKMLPNELNKYVKQWGAKVTNGEIGAGAVDSNPWKARDATDDGNGAIEAEFRTKAEANAYGEEHGGVNIVHEPGGTVGVHSIDITPAMRESVQEGQPLFSKRDDDTPSDPSREPGKSMKDLSDVLKHGDPSGVRDQAKDWLRGKFEDFRPAMLGALQTRHVLELMEDVSALKGAGKLYGKLMQQMDADRQHLMAGAPDAAEHPTDMLKKGAVTIAQDLRKYAYGKSLRGRVKPEAQKLFDIMHAATIQRMDPSKAYERLTIENAHGDAVPWTHAGIKDRLKLLRELALQRGGDPWATRDKLRDEVKYLRKLPQMERLRERNWPKLQADYMALPDEAKRLYGETRDWYSAYRDATEEALIHNIEALNVPETYRRSMVNRMRLQFEEARREGVYFPLNRDGDFWIAFQDKEGNEGFKMFETAREYGAAEKRLRAAGFQINAKGRRDANMKAKDAPSGTFVRDVIDTLSKAGVSETVQDQVYQTFLRSLPEMSMRKHSIHRRNIAGFSEDALRAFAKNGYHGAHQLARLRHSQDMGFALEAMKTSVDNWRRGENATDAQKEPNALDVAKADALVGEMQKRHDWIMHPTDQRLANMVNSLGFIWYLGASPASALTNLSQVVQTTLPVLGAEHGWPKATRMLGAAWRDAARTVGHMDRTLTDPEERRAFMVMQQRGDFSKTQAHTLAGLAEGNVLQTTPAWSRSMNAISWMFHTAELVNREATGMAAYRLARAKGMDFNKAVEYAGDVNANTNFDYSAANRPRLMQGNVQRIALQFKNYSVGMTWLMYRNLFQAMKAEDPQVRRVARRTVTGIMGMTAILAGTTGLPVYNAVRMTANAANTLFGDDNEPWNFDDAFHRWLADNLGSDAARLIAEGPTNYLTGANLATRTSLSNLWIQNDDQRLEGADAYHALLENLAGPIGGITQNFYVGAEDVRRGNIERGVERMLPTSVKNSIKAMRYAHEGVNSLRGDPIVPDVSGYQDFLQAIGFQPAAVADQYRINTAMKNYTSEIQDRRMNLMNAYAMAIKAGDPDDRGAAVQKISAFNAAHPQVAITVKSLRSSLMQRARLSAQARNGVVLNRKLALQAQQYAGATQ